MFELVANDKMKFFVPEREKTDVIDVDRASPSAGSQGPVAPKQEPADPSGRWMASDGDDVPPLDRSFSGAQPRSLTPSPPPRDPSDAAPDAAATPSGSRLNSLAHYLTPSTDRRLSFTSAAPEPAPAAAAPPSSSSLLPPAPQPPGPGAALGPCSLFSPVKTDQLPPLARAATLVPTRPGASREPPDARAGAPSAEGTAAPTSSDAPPKSAASVPPPSSASRVPAATAPASSSAAGPRPPRSVPFSFCAEPFLDPTDADDTGEVCGGGKCLRDHFGTGCEGQGARLPKTKTPHLLSLQLIPLKYRTKERKAGWVFWVKVGTFTSVQAPLTRAGSLHQFHWPRDTSLPNYQTEVSPETPVWLHCPFCLQCAGAAGRDVLEGKGPQRRPQQPFDRRLEEVAKAVGGGYCWLQIPLKLALGVRETVAGHRPGALEGEGGTPPPSNAPLAAGAARSRPSDGCPSYTVPVSGGRRSPGNQPNRTALTHPHIVVCVWARTPATNASTTPPGGLPGGGEGPSPFPIL